jgi:hypothetical protein
MTPGPSHLLGGESQRGQQHVGEAESEPKAFRTLLREARVIWRKLNCLNLSFQRCNTAFLAYNAYTARPPADRPSSRNRELPTGGRWEVIPLKEANETPKSRYQRLSSRNVGSPTGREPYGDGASVVVRGRESRPHGEGRQVSLRPRKRGTRDA